MRKCSGGVACAGGEYSGIRRVRNELDQPTELACPHCGYNVAIIPGNRCPECGHSFDRSQLVRARFEQSGPRLWQPLTLILTIPIAIAALFVFAAMGLGGSVLMLVPPLGAIVLSILAIASFGTAPTLAMLLQQRGMGQGLSQNRFTRLLAIAALLLQLAILGAGVVIAHALSGPWRMPF